MGSTRMVSGARVAALALLVAVIGIACTPPPTYVPASPDTPVWMAGDSLSGGTGSSMLTYPYVASVGNSAFGAPGHLLIIDHLDSQMQKYGQPETVMIMGGVIDVARGVPTETILADMQALEDHLVSQGINVVWLAQPGYTYAAGLTTLSEWIDAKPLSIDCRSKAGPDKDGVHPIAYRAMADCVSKGMAALGFTW